MKTILRAWKNERIAKFANAFFFC